jgi:hypothetical protein
MGRHVARGARSSLDCRTNEAGFGRANGGCATTLQTCMDGSGPAPPADTTVTCSIDTCRADAGWKQAPTAIANRMKVAMQVRIIQQPSGLSHITISLSVLEFYIPFCPNRTRLSGQYQHFL